LGIFDKEFAGQKTKTSQPGNGRLHGEVRRKLGPFLEKRRLIEVSSVKKKQLLIGGEHAIPRPPGGGVRRGTRRADHAKGEGVY